MAHITSSHTAVNTAGSNAVPSECSLDLEDSDSSKEGTRSDKSAGGGGDSSSISTMTPNSCMVVVEEEEKTERGASSDVRDDGSVSGPFEDTSCSGGARKKKKQHLKSSRKEVNKALSRRRDNSSECRTIKAADSQEQAVSAVPTVEVEGCAAPANATMDRVNSDDFFGRSGSPSSENDWEASDDHSDTDADHSDSSDDDNPTSQVDRMIECGTRLIMDDENSNLSSETDDTDDDDDDDFNDDSDSDITDVSPLVSTAASPLGLSPVMSRRSLPSSISTRPPFMRHYSHHGHDGDVEDEEDEDLQHHQQQHTMTNQWTDDLYHHQQQPGNDTGAGLDTDSANMSLVVQALLKIGLENVSNARRNSSDSLESTNNYHNNNKLPHIRRHSHMSPAIQANPHHRHLRKGVNHHHQRRKNMSFTNEEVGIINRDNSIILQKLLSVNSRHDRTHHTNGQSYKHTNKPASATINRRRQEEGIQKENLAILRRLQEVKPSRAVTATPSTSRHPGRHHHHHSSHHHHHHHHSNPSSGAVAVRSCSATARHTAFSPPHHHSPKETAL